MSIATEITRLQNAKSSIKTAIEGKGVEVPSTTKLDGYGELISSIPSGGGDETAIQLIERTGTEFTIPNGTTKIGAYAFRSAPFSVINIPTTVTSIENGAMYSAKVVSLTIPDSVISVGAEIFRTATQLQSLTIGRGITNSDFHASLYGCSNLTTLIVLGNLKKFFSNDTIGGCTSLELVDLSNCTSVPTLATANIFRSVPSTCVVKIPSALYNDWIAATNWATLYNNESLVFEAV